MTILAPTTRILQRGDTLGGINLTIEVTSPIPEVLRVKTSHHLGVCKKGPEFELEHVKEGAVLSVDEDDKAIRVTSGFLSL